MATPKTEEQAAELTLKWGISERAAIASAEAELKLHKTAVNRAVDGALQLLNVSSYIGPEGTLTRVAGGVTSSIDKEKLAQILLLAGVDPDVVKASIKAATKITQKADSITFKARKVK